MRYSVSLLAGNDCGWSDQEKVMAITVYDTPQAKFTATPLTGPVPLEVQFTDTSDNDPVTRNWNFGDGYFSTQKDLKHTFSNLGVYTVKLTVTNSSGLCSSEKQAVIRVLAANTLNGKILDQETVTGISGAAVLVMGHPEYRSITDTNGEFTITSLPLGTYTLQIIAPHYETKYFSLDNQADQKNIPNVYLNPNIGWADIFGVCTEYGQQIYPAAV